MPAGTKVWKCVQELKAKGMPEGQAIAICQEQTGHNYQTGKPIKKKQDA